MGKTRFLFTKISSKFKVIFLIMGSNRAQTGDEIGFGFGLEKSGSGRAQHLRPVDNSDLRY